MKQMGVLGKSDTNPHHRYNYVPIDAYYEKVARKAMEHGLIWRIHEVSAKSSGQWVRFVYKVDLIYSNEDGFGYWPDYDTINIYHPVQGAQTAGSARSYAEKVFMRSCFKVQTGEEDADATAELDIPADDEMGEGGDPFSDMSVEPNDDGSAEVRGEGGQVHVAPDTLEIMKLPDGDREKILSFFSRVFLPMCKDAKMLRQGWSKNTATFQRIMKKDEDLFTRIQDMFKKKQEELNG